VPLKNNRIAELMSAIEESDGKIIIWAYFRHSIEEIKLTLQKEYGMNAVATYFGDTPDEERSEIVERFQDMDNELRFFVGQPRTGGYGLTLDSGAYNDLLRQWLRPGDPAAVRSTD
jgi:SNF2 family DNA or RNA helicase